MFHCIFLHGDAARQRRIEVKPIATLVNQRRHGGRHGDLLSPAISS
jgi:hypothetical protein